MAPKYPWNSPYAFSENSVIRFVELEGLEKADALSFQNASVILENWKNNPNTNTLFNLDKNVFAAMLSERINTNPDGTDQTGTWLCGPSAASQIFINYNPEAYVKGLIELYENGETKINKKTLKIPQVMKDEVFDASGYSNGDAIMNAVDYIFLGAIRNSFNQTLGKFDTDSGNNLEQGTLPYEMKNILEKALGLGVTSHSVYPNDLSLQASLSNIEYATKNGLWVMLFENHGITHGNPEEGFYGKWGIHYIVIDELEVD